MAYSKNTVNTTIEIKFGADGTPTQESILIKKGEPLRLISASGFFAPTHEVGKEDYAKDGGKITNKRYGMRSLGITFGIADLPNSEQIRSEVMRKLQANKLCTITAERNGRKGEIECSIEGEPEINQPNYTRDRAAISLSFISEEPFFKATAKKQLALAYGSTVISNESDAPTGFTITIKAKAALKNPVVLNSDGEYTRIIGDFSANDTILIVSDGSEHYIQVNGKDYFNYDIKSVFFDMQPGITEIAIGSDAGTSIEANIQYQERYLGI